MSTAAMHRYVVYGIDSVACGVVGGPRHLGPQMFFSSCDVICCCGPWPWP